VKWARDGGTFTFKELIKAEGNAPSLIGQLADGSQRIAAANPGRAVFVHLVTNEIPSVADDVPAGDLKPVPSHFSAFLSQAWHPIQRGESTDVPPVWREAWGRLREASGISEAEWLDFVSRCVLEFGCHPPEATALPASDQAQFVYDLNGVTLLLFREPGSPERIVELSRSELINRLGWQGRFEFKARHEFPLSYELYAPIESTRRELQAALDGLVNGYLAVLGSPGSGKSTLLTEVLRGRAERIVRYYAYVPDSLTPRTLRGESASFLHDVVLALDRAGVRAGTSLIGLDRTQLQHRLHEQMHRLSLEWRENGRKTFILVDGLDHIEREQHPERSLLRDLPVPEEVPEGVLFVLGSQTDQLQELPDRIKHAIQQPGRRIEMQSLTRSAVHAVVDRSRLPRSTFPDLVGRAYDASGGHPLALRLILDRLKEAVDDDSVEATLTNWMHHAGSVQAEYYSYWRSIEADPRLARLLALLARLRRPVDLEWIQTWTDMAVMKVFRGSARHYFRREGNRWYFFHNSFRQFLLRATAEGVDGGFDTVADRAFHAELADHCANATAPTWNWEELHHRCLAGQDRTVLDKATPDYFRQQFLQFRPLDRINADIDSCFQSLRRERDVPKLARLILAGSEMRQRSSELEGGWVIRALLDLGKLEIATEHLRDGQILLASNAFTLEIAGRLKREGSHDAANFLFELAEPLDLLHGNVDDAHRSNRDVRAELETWASTAPLFNAVADVIERIEALPEMREDQHLASTTHDLKLNLLFKCGETLLQDQRWDDLDRLMETFDRSQASQRDAWIWLNLFRCAKHFEVQDREKGQTVMQRIQGELEPAQFGSEATIKAASLVYRLFGDMKLAQRIVSGTQIPVPDPHKFSFTTGDFWQFEQLYDFRRLQRITGKTQPPFDIAPTSGVRDAEKIEYFVGCVATDVNRRIPDAAAGRITWFAQATASLRDSTEGRAAYNAADDLLEATFQWSPRNSVTLLWWLVDQQVLSFARGVATLLTATLRSADGVEVHLIEYVFAELVLPIDTTGHPQLADEFIRQIERAEGRASAINATVQLSAAFGSHCPHVPAEYSRCVVCGCRARGCAAETGPSRSTRRWA
jgi:hypothetical protein